MYWDEHSIGVIECEDSDFREFWSFLSSLSLPLVLVLLERRLFECKASSLRKSRSRAYSICLVPLFAARTFFVYFPPFHSTTLFLSLPVDSQLSPLSVIDWSCRFEVSAYSSNPSPLTRDICSTHPHPFSFPL